MTIPRTCDVHQDAGARGEDTPRLGQLGEVVPGCERGGLQQFA